MTNFALSLIRTWTPILIGAVVAWLLTLGIEIDSETQASLVIALTGVLQAIYYALARALEVKYPRLGVLLGTTKQPEYKD